jgi:hypothetical protein
MCATSFVAVRHALRARPHTERWLAAWPLLSRTACLAVSARSASLQRDRRWSHGGGRAPSPGRRQGRQPPCVGLQPGACRSGSAAKRLGEERQDTPQEEETM